MESLVTDRDRLSFLLETEAEFQFDQDLLSAQAADDSKIPDELTSEKKPKYITNYIGSKQKLIDWIWKNTPDEVESVFDAFSGSAVVAYMYKSKGLQVFANDRLKYSYHAARALIENSSTKLSNDDIEILLAKNSEAGNFVHDNFKGIFFADGVHTIIDQIRANCDKLAGFKKDIALFALGKTCMSGKGGFGHFSAATENGKRQDSPDEFKDRFRKNAERINALVFDNNFENKAYNSDINEILPKVKVDLAYFDPPYATEFSTTNYEKAYHFVEGLMTYWEGLKIKQDTKVKAYEITSTTVTKANANEFFTNFLTGSNHIPHWLISYRDHAYPNETDMKKIIANCGRETRMMSKDHHYSITARHGDASNAKERLFICRRASASNSKGLSFSKTPLMDAQANFHTRIPIEISFSKENDLRAEGMDVTAIGDPQFSFILCRVGTNKNGDNFSKDELQNRYMTAVNKKIDLQHSQDVSDIVGGIISADFLEDESGGRIECIGELYTHDSQYAQLAYKLIKRGIIAQVSMECDYEEGECSICGKRFTTKADYCTHLRKFKGALYNGEPVYEILHNVTFTGLGLLDRKGADENARILQVASTQDLPQTNKDQGGIPMEEPKQNVNQDQAADAAKKPVTQPPDNGNGGGDSGGGGGSTNPRVTELEKENRQLKTQISELQKRIQELEAAQKAAAGQVRASKLIEKLEKLGLEFSSDAKREEEFNRLAGLSDEAFAATEAAFDLGFKNGEHGAKGAKEGDDKKEPPKSKANFSSNAMNNDSQNAKASFRPHDVDDKKVNLEEKLRSGFMAAYQERLGEEATDFETINV